MATRPSPAFTTPSASAIATRSATCTRANRSGGSVSRLTASSRAMRLRPGEVQARRRAAAFDSGRPRRSNRRVRVPVPLNRAWRLLNHGPVTMISSAAGERRNVMAAAWVMALDFDPSKLAAVIAQDAWTRELVDASGECVVQVPTAAQADLVWTVGSVSGREVDKFAAYGIATAPASVVAAPLVEGCVAWLECKVVPEPGIAERYDLFVLETVAAWADDEVWDGREWRWGAPDDPRRSLHHLTRGLFYATGVKREAKVLRSGP